MNAVERVKSSSRKKPLRRPDNDDDNGHDGDVVGGGGAGAGPFDPSPARSSSSTIAPQTRFASSPLSEARVWSICQSQPTSRTASSGKNVPSLMTGANSKRKFGTPRASRNPSRRKKSYKCRQVVTFRRPSLFRNSLQRAEPIIVPPWKQDSIDLVRVVRHRDF